jgi:hypothetical protein
MHERRKQMLSLSLRNRVAVNNVNNNFLAPVHAGASRRQNVNSNFLAPVHAAASRRQKYVPQGPRQMPNISSSRASKGTSTCSPTIFLFITLPNVHCAERER